MHNYHTAIRSFPMGINMWIPNGSCSTPPGNYSDGKYGWSWTALLTPYLEQVATHDLFDFNESGTTDPISFRAGGTFVPSYLCPSDPQSGEYVNMTNYFTYHNGPTEQDDFTTANVAGVADSIDYTCGPDDLWPKPDANGVLFQRSGVRVADILDGTTHTLMAGEVVGQGTGTHAAYTWVTWNILDTHNGINLPLRIPPSALFRNPDETGFASRHPGGCHFLFGDGSVHLLSENINQPVLAALTTRADGEVTDAGSY